jgi:gamma-glutamyltranspeptidase
VRVETRISEEATTKLREMGYQVSPAGEWSIGDGTALMVDQNRGVLFGAAGPRRDKSYALGW